MPPTMLLVLPFDGISLWVTVCFLGATSTGEEAFCEKLWVGWEGDLEYGLSSQQKHQFVVDKKRLIIDLSP